MSLVFEMGVSRDREKGRVTITKEKYTNSLLEHYGMTPCNSTYTPGAGNELSLDQPEERFLGKEGTQRCLAIMGNLMYPGPVTRYDILYDVKQLARAMSKSSKAHILAAKHLRLYLAGTVDFAITYKQCGFKLTEFHVSNWGKTRITASRCPRMLSSLRTPRLASRGGCWG